MSRPKRLLYPPYSLYFMKGNAAMRKAFRRMLLKYLLILALAQALVAFIVDLIWLSGTWPQALLIGVVYLVVTLIVSLLVIGLIFVLPPSNDE